MHNARATKGLTLGLVSLVALSTLHSCRYNGQWLTMNTAKETLAMCFVLNTLDATLDPFVLNGEAQDSAACPDMEDSGVATWPREILIDFGTGCTDNHDVTRKGQLLVTQSAPHNEIGAVFIVEFEGFSIVPPEAYQEPWLHTDPTMYITGERTLVRAPNDNQGRPKWYCSHHLTANFLNHTLTDQMEGMRMAADSDDPDRWNPAYSGSHTTSTDAGPEIIRSISDALVFSRDCGEPVQGVFLIDRSAHETEVQGVLTSHPEPLPDAVLDLGDGVCDGMASITVEERVSNVTIGVFTNW